MEEFARKDDRYSQRADGSLRPRPRAQPASPALTQPVWRSAPFGVEEAPPARTPPASRRPTKSPARPRRPNASHTRECMITQPSTIATVGGSAGLGSALDDGGAVVSTPPQKRPSASRTNEPLEKLLAAKRNTSVGKPASALRRQSASQQLPTTPPGSHRVTSPAWSPRTYSASPRYSASPTRDKPKDPGLEALASVPILRGLTPKERDELARRLDSRPYRRGERIIAEGEKGDSLFIVSSGKAEAEVEGVGVVRQYLTGQWFGELALISGNPRGATVTAMTECTMLVLQRVDFEHLIGKLGDKLEALRRRFDSAAYSYGRKDFSKLFRHYDRDNSGFLDLAQFRAACRKDGHVKIGDVGEREIRCLYYLIDLDGDGQIGEADWLSFMGAVDPRSLRQKLMVLGQRRRDLDTQCRAAMQHGTPQMLAKAKELVIDMQTVDAEIAELQGDASRIHRADQRRIFNYQFEVKQLHACEVQMEKLQAEANDP